MNPSTAPRLVKWPFVLGDVLLFGTTAVIVILSDRPIGGLQFAVAILAVALGGWLCVIPYLLEYRTVVRLAESGKLVAAVQQIQRIQQLADQVSVATAQWQTVQEQSAETVAAAREVTRQITAEARAFTEFLRKANDSERNHLRLEVEKLRKMEGEWLQALVRILDHVYALHQAAARSAQPQVVAQMDRFQNACRDAARRLGVVPYTADADAPFDPGQHQLQEGAEAPPGALVGGTLACGYRYQGQVIRRAAVRLLGAGADEAEFSTNEIASRHGQGEADAQGDGDSGASHDQGRATSEAGFSEAAGKPETAQPSETGAETEPFPGEALPGDPLAAPEEPRKDGKEDERFLL